MYFRFRHHAWALSVLSSFPAYERSGTRTPLPSGSSEASAPVLLRGTAYGLYILKMAHKGLSPGRPDALDIIQYRSYLPFSPQASVIFNGKAVGLILNPCDKPEAFAVTVNGDLYIIIIKSSGPVVIILYHTAHRNGKPQLIKDLQGNIYLSSVRRPS